MLTEIVGLSWFWVSLVLALSLFLGLAQHLAPVRPTKAPGVGTLPAAGLLTGLVALAVAALAAALVGVYIRPGTLGIAVVDYLLPFFTVMALVLGILRIIWPRDFAVPVVTGYPVLGSLLQGVTLALIFLATAGTSIHFNLGWFLPTLPRLLPMLITAAGLWLYFLQEEGLKDALARSRGLLFALVLGLGSKLVIALVWQGTKFLPNPPSFEVITIPVALAGLLLLEALSAALRVWSFGPVAISVFTSVVIAWTVAVILPLA